MSSRKDLDTGRLIFTCRCGFVDTGHANPKGPKALWSQIDKEVDLAARPFNPVDPVTSKLPTYTLEGAPAFLISYGQSMGSVVSLGETQAFIIRKGLPLHTRKEIALRIFMDVSLAFEQMQDSWPYSWVTDSGFSAEDLISNLIGFYRAVEGYKWQQVLNACEQTSLPAAKQAYDGTFSDGIGARKVKEFFKPVVVPCAECTNGQTFPNLFTRIVPASLGTGDFISVEALPPPYLTKHGPVDFDRFGKRRVKKDLSR